MNAVRCSIWMLAALGLMWFTTTTHGSPYCCEGEKSLPLAGQIDEALIVMFGHFENAKLANDGLERGHSDLVIERVFKEHDMIKGKKMLRLPQYMPDPKQKFIVFGDVYKGKIDAYKGMAVTYDAEMLKYIEGLLKNKGKTQPERLRYAFDFLNSPEIEVSMDAYREFARADYRDYKDIAKKLPADTLQGWLKDPKTPAYRYGLYATLLGHCGNAKHAEFLLEMINDPERRKNSGLHGLIMAYSMIEPQKGWKFTKDLVLDTKQSFFVRYAGLQTMRFLYEARTDVVDKDDARGKKEVINGVIGILTVPDMADFAIEDLRKWKRWECCDQILAMFGQKPYHSKLISKSILRFALQCPSDNARRFVKAQEALDKEWVDDTRELLDLETVPARVTPTTK